MAGFLLDVHLPLAVTDAFQRLVPDAEIAHVARWRSGSLRTATDEEILAAAAEAGLVLVTIDISTVRDVCDRWVADSRAFPGVVFIVGPAKTNADIGGIARALAELGRQPQMINPSYPVVYLRPMPVSYD